MRNIYLMFKVMRMNTNADSLAKINKLKKNKSKNYNDKLKKVFLVLFMIAYLTIIFGKSGVNNARAYLAGSLDLRSAVISSAIFPLMLSVLAIPVVMSILFLADDLECFLVLPVKPFELVAAKIMTVLYYEILTGMAVMLPNILAFAIYSKQAFDFYIFAVISSMLIILIPVAIFSILIILFMYFFKFIRNKEKITLVSTLITLVIFFGAGFAAGFIGDGRNQHNFTDIFAKIPGFNFWLKSIEENRWLNMFLFFVVILLATALLLILANKLFLPIAMRLKNSVGKREKISDKTLLNRAGEKGLLRTLLLREHRMIVRSSTLLMNSFGVSVFIIAMFIFGTIFLAVKEPLMFAQLGGYATVVFQNYRVVFLVALLYGVFVLANTYMAQTSFSREGKNILALVTLPIDIKDIIKAKLLYAHIFAALALAVLPVLLLIIGVPLKVAIAFYFLANISGLNNNVLLFTIDFNEPQLNWDNEIEIFKANFRLMFIQILILGECFIYGVLIYFMSAAKENGMNFWQRDGFYIGIGIVIQLAILCFNILMLRKGIKNWQKNLAVE